MSGKKFELYILSLVGLVALVGILLLLFQNPQGNQESDITGQAASCWVKGPTYPCAQAKLGSAQCGSGCCTGNDRCGDGSCYRWSC